MSSIAARKVANEVMETVGNGMIPNLVKIQEKHGYSKLSAKAHKVRQTKTYQRIEESLVRRLEKERDAIIERMQEVRDEAKYRDLSDGLDKTTKVLQLLTGGATENIAVKPLATLDELRQDNSN